MSETFSRSWVEAETARTAEAWRGCASLPVPSCPLYTPQEQRLRELEYDRAMHAVEREVKSSSHSKRERLAAQDRILALFAEFAGTALSLSPDAVELIISSFLPAGAEFARCSRRFDPTLSMAAIVQACRNAWTVCGLQPLLGEPTGITSSIVGYSLLYPYTDNYLDAQKESFAAKHEFCRRFRQRLRGHRLPAMGRHEATVWALVEMIEEQYPRTCYPQVFDSLLAIHRAQEESMAQLARRKAEVNGERHEPFGLEDTCTSKRILSISFAKGGTSVLADACLARGWVNGEESRLAFDWGALLQLGDDLQDVREDLRRGSATLFTRAVAEGAALDDLVRQLLNFSELVGDEMYRFSHGSVTLKDLLRTSWRSLIIAAVANISELFTPAFRDEMEAASPFRFSFLNTRSKRVTRRSGLYASVFEILTELPEEEALFEGVNTHCTSCPAV